MKTIKASFAALILCITITGCCHSGQPSAAPCFESQAVDLPGVTNARQLGGYRIGKKYIRKDLLIRSGALPKASDEALATLADDYSLAAVFDFRSSFERGENPDREVNGAANIWLPCLERTIRECFSKPEISNVYANRKDIPALLAAIQEPAAVAYLHDQYADIVFDEDDQRSYAAFLDTLAGIPEGRAVLWHCAQGKDRAGWASAFLLAALGADRDLIIADFALSNAGYQEDIDRVVAAAREQNLSPEVESNLKTVLGVNPDDFARTLDMIDSRYGSMDAFLEQALQLTAGEKASLRRKYLSRRI